MKTRKRFLFIFSLVLGVNSLVFGIYFGNVKKDFFLEKKNKVLDLKKIIENKVKIRNYNLKKIKILINRTDFNLFQKEQALFAKEGWIDKRNANYYKCKLKIGDYNFKGKIRVKGLLLKPWEYENGFFSYKIKLQDNMLNNLDRFYLNYPKKRNNLQEFYGDHICKYFGLIYQKNHFYNLEINEVNKGLYLFEEAFDERLLSHNKRPEGPIIFFTKNNLISMGTENYGKSFLKSEIINQFPSKYNKTSKKLLKDFLVKKSSAKEVFDFEKTATQFVLADLVGYYHQLNYHNVKFYYNPTTKKIEPIANDFQFYDLKKWTNETYGIVFNKQNYDSKYLNYLDAPWMKILFENKEFYSLYLEKLGDFSSENKIDSLFNYLTPYEDSAIRIMSTFEPFYVPKVKSIIKKNAEYIRNILKKQKPILINSSKIDSNNNIIL
jgi:hypothetical protein